MIGEGIVMSENNFYSVDKLVEFGMGMAVANQMVNSMNVSLNQMMIPGAGSSANSGTESIYYAVLDNKASGPYSLTELIKLLEEKKIAKETYVWKPGMREWGLTENIDEIRRNVAGINLTELDKIKE